MKDTFYLITEKRYITLEDDNLIKVRQLIHKGFSLQKALQLIIDNQKTLEVF